MATLTYDPTPADQPEFNEEETAALELGEQLEQEQSQLLAGKYQDAEELEKAYLELQQKMGGGEQQQQEEEVEEEEEQVTSDLLERLWNESDGEFSADLMEELNNSTPQEIADMYLDFRSNQAPVNAEMTEGEVSSIRESVGGADNYQEMINWAASNLSENEVALFDSVIEKGEAASVFFAVQALNYRFNDTQGVDGQLIAGGTPTQVSNQFRSQAEVVQAMSDPRYDSDPAYRQDVYSRLESSQLNYQ
jgi:hypothetical protein